MRPFGKLASKAKQAQPDDPPLMTPTPEQLQLRQAMVLRGQRRYREAVEIYASLISTRPNAREAKCALAAIRNMYHDYLQWSGDTTLQTALETYLRAQILNHPNAIISRIAKTLRAAEINSRRDYASAVQEYQQLLQSATLDEDRRECLFALFDISAYGLHSRSEARTYLTQMQNQFPNDVRTDIAATRFLGMIDQSDQNGMQKSSLAGNSEKVQLPLQFNLSQNYPNPFNPLTSINFDLPVDAHTHLKMYDVLGREVASLVDEDRAAGYHKASFDGSRFASGVYFYRMQAFPGPNPSGGRSGGFASVKKLVLVK